MSTPLGDAIRRVRMGAGLSQREAARRIEVDASYLSHLEAGRREPSIRTLRALVHAGDCPRELIERLAWALADTLTEPETEDE